MSNPQLPTTGLLLSGGIDSVVLLDQLLATGWRVTPFYVSTDCVWQTSELRAIERILDTLVRPNLMDLVVLEMPLADLYGNHWSISGADVPDEATPNDAVFLPGRNSLLLIKPALWCQMHHIKHLALATLAGNPFEDATPHFFEQIEEMLATSGEGVTIERPFERLAKQQVLQMGRHLPLELTFSCLSPVAERHCGRCNKCAERQKGFSLLGRDDPTPYAHTIEKPTHRQPAAKR